MKRLFPKNIPLGGKESECIPTCIAINKVDNNVLIGNEAKIVNSDEYDLLINWKMLIGKSKSEIISLAANDDVLKRLLEKHDYRFQSVLDSFFNHVLGYIDKLSFDIKPELIIGIPVTSDYESKKWRNRYRTQISDSFVKNGFPKPKFFPEPFAVFQYHWNREDIRDTGKCQNIFIVDIGGGTTNVCLIQTTQHGRIARGGANHLPHGMKSSQVGGSTIDQLLFDKLIGQELISDKTNMMLKLQEVKEFISNEVAEQQMWSDNEYLSSVSYEEGLDGFDEKITALKLKNIIEDIFWSSVRETVFDSLDEIKNKTLPNKIDGIDLVVFAGGTCQLKLIQWLFNRDVCSKYSILEKSGFFISPDFRKAVSDGLSIEAFANSQHHEIKPSRMSAYLTDDLRFLVSHRSSDDLSIPNKLRAYSDDIKINSQKGVIIESPESLSPLIGDQLTWRFKLKQKATDIYYNFSKVDTIEDKVIDDLCVNSLGRIKVSKRNEESTNLHCHLNLTLQDDGFAKLTIDTKNSNNVEVSHKLDPIDLHDIGELHGDSFIGLDFGTNTTLCSYISVDDEAVYEFLPKEYWVDSATQRRCHELEAKSKKTIRSQEATKLIFKLNKKLLNDYVYQSNRIEGSELNRGQTRKILSNIQNSVSEQASSVEYKVEKFPFLNDSCEVVYNSKPIKDGMAAINLRDAFSYMEEISFDNDFVFTKHSLKELHSLVMKGDEKANPGVFRSDKVTIGQTCFVPPDFTQVNGFIDNMFEYLNSDKFNSLPVLLQAAEAHVRFVSIHPFTDGNGRVARLLANFYLWRRGVPGLLLSWQNRDRYYDALDQCNTREVKGKPGDMSDLVRLFCDAFEDILLDADNVLVSGDNDIEVQLNVVTEDVSSESGTAFDMLLSRISKKSIVLDYDDQYDIWFNCFSVMLNDLQKKVDMLSRHLDASSIDVKVYLIKYQLIDKDTYMAIRTHEKFSRTWFVKLIVETPNKSEEIVLYFGCNSTDSSLISSDLDNTCSLHISRFNRDLSKHVNVADELWTRVHEVVHNGKELGVLYKNIDGVLNVYFDEKARIDEWFGVLVNDILIDCNC